VLQSAFAMGLVLASGVWLYVAPSGQSAWRSHVDGNDFFTAWSP